MKKGRRERWREPGGETRAKQARCAQSAGNELVAVKVERVRIKLRIMVLLLMIENVRLCE